MAYKCMNYMPQVRLRHIRYRRRQPSPYGKPSDGIGNEKTSISGIFLSCCYIDEHLLQTVSGHLGIPVGKVRRLIEDTKALTDKRDAVYSEWAAKRDFYYVRYKSATLQLHKVDEAHLSVIKRLKNRQAYCYARWQGYLKRMNQYTRGPSNRVLAKQLGISRTTINKDLAELKKACYGK